MLSLADRLLPFPPLVCLGRALSLLSEHSRVFTDTLVKATVHHQPGQQQTALRGQTDGGTGRPDCIGTVCLCFDLFVCILKVCQISMCLSLFFDPFSS